MATAGGLIIGAVGLGSLYETCVECYTVFHKIRAFHRDSRYLASKLETENALFRQWGERAGLMSGRKRGIDPQLRDPWTRRAVEGVLSCIHILLTDTDKFQTTYGLIPFEPSDDITQSRSSSSTQVQRHSNSQSWPSDVTRPERKHVTILRKFHWSILDKEKFNDLVTELRDHVQRLNELVPTKGDAPEYRAVTNDIRERADSSKQRDRRQRRHREEFWRVLDETQKQSKPISIMPLPRQVSDRAMTIRPKTYVEEIAPRLTREFWHTEDQDNCATHRCYRIS